MASLEAMFAEHVDVVARFRASGMDPLRAATALAIECLLSGGKILVCGNGGSAADAQHFAAECIARF